MFSFIILLIYFSHIINSPFSSIWVNAKEILPQWLVISVWWRMFFSCPSQLGASSHAIPMPPTRIVHNHTVVILNNIKMLINLLLICSLIHWATNNCYPHVYPLATPVLGNGGTRAIGFLLSCVCRLKENTNGKMGNNKRFGIVECLIDWGAQEVPRVGCQRKFSEKDW